MSTMILGVTRGGDVVAVNPREFIGANNPPEPTPFDLSKAEIDGLVMEAGNWVDGSGVQSEIDSANVSKLIEDLRGAKKTAKERRVAETRPLDDAKAEVMARYNPLIQDDKGSADIAIRALKDALAPYLQRKADALLAEQNEKRRIADEKAAAAVEAIRASRQGAPDLAARQAAEVMVTEAKQAEKVAAKVENMKTHATGGTRAIGLRTVRVATLDDPNAFAKWVWANRNPELVEWLTGLAKSEVRTGALSLPGVTITEEKML